jgi:hypothetical protein
MLALANKMPLFNIPEANWIVDWLKDDESTATVVPAA